MMKKQQAVTYHDLRRAIVKTLPKGGRHYSLSQINRYCVEGEVQGDSDLTKESDLIEILLKTKDWNNLQIMRILSTVRLRKKYYDKVPKKIRDEYNGPFRI